MDIDEGPGIGLGAGAGNGICNYVVTAHKPTAVSRAVVGNFTSPTDINLISACCTRLEIQTLQQDGLQAFLEFPIYGNITALQLFRPRDLNVDLLFLLTDKYKFAVLQYDAAAGQLVTRANGDVSDRIGRPADNGQLGLVEAAPGGGRVIALHLYDGMLKLIPMDERSGALSEAFNVRLEELCVLDMAWLQHHAPAGPGAGAAAGPSSAGGSGGGAPMLCVLYEDGKKARHLKTYEVSLPAKDLVDGPWQQQHLDAGACHLIPVPAPLGGVVVVGESALVYLNGAQPPVAAPTKHNIVTAWGRVDPDGSRYLLGDRQGGLALMVLAHEGSRVNGIRLERLGHTSIPSALCYLDAGLTYVGSRMGDSQLVKIHAQPINQAAPMAADGADDDAGTAAVAAGGSAPEPPTYVEVLESFPNLGPIVDFVVMDLERQGQGQVVTCSGVDGDGTLRVIRNGIGINAQAAVELPGVKGVWSLRAHYGDEHDTYLLLTFVGETRLLALNQDEELDEAVLPGFAGGAQTLWCGNTAHDQLLQVTSASVRLVDASGRTLLAEWAPPPGSAINVAAGSATQVVVATGGGRLVCLEVGPSSGPAEGLLREVAATQLAAEVACVDMTPVGSDPERSRLVCVGTWSQQLLLLSLPGLAQVACEELGGEVIPRSVLAAQLEGAAWVLVGLGDGTLHSWRLDAASGALSDRKRVVLGTKPITLRTFRSGAAAGGGDGGGGGNTGSGVSVFAGSDRPTIIYSANKKLLYANLNENDVSYLCSFHSAAFPHSLAVAGGSGLTIGTIDQLQKLHVRTLPLGEQPRRIAHHEASRTLGVLTQRMEPSGEERSYLRLIDDTSFDVVASFALEDGEVPCSVAACAPGALGAGAQGDEAGTSAAGPSGSGSGARALFVVGTALLRPDEQEPSKGRLLLLEHQGGDKVRVVAEREVRGAVYNVMPFVAGRLLASINNKVTVYRVVTREGSGVVELASECSYLGNVMALYLATRGPLVLVGDLMRSVSVLAYNAEQGSLEQRAQDYATGWTTAVEILDDDTYLAADNFNNLYVTRRNADSATDEERARLQVVGEWHAGCFVNRFRHGSLVMRLPDSETAEVVGTPLLFGGTDGRLGVLARLPKQLYGQLEALQRAMRQVVKGVGGLFHDQWRMFSNERRSVEARGFVDGDLVEAFLDLGPQDAAKVAALVGGGSSVEELTRLVEDLARSLH